MTPNQKKSYHKGSWAGMDLEQNPNRVKKCKYCNAEIVWLRAKSGKSYPVNFLGLVDVRKDDFHKCKN